MQIIRSSFYTQAVRLALLTAGSVICWLVLQTVRSRIQLSAYEPLRVTDVATNQNVPSIDSSLNDASPSYSSCTVNNGCNQHPKALHGEETSTRDLHRELNELDERAKKLSSRLQPDIHEVSTLSPRHLKEMFWYTDTNTRITTLWRLNPRGQDADFIIDVLYRDEDASVRQVAARKLLFTQSNEVKAAFLNALTDEDETVVMLALNGLASYDDASVRHQVNSLLATRRNTAIKLTMQTLGYL